MRLKNTTIAREEKAVRMWVCACVEEVGVGRRGEILVELKGEGEGKDSSSDQQGVGLHLLECA